MTMLSWLSHPLTRGLSIDDRQTTELRRRIVREKPFLSRIYREWYQAIAAEVPVGPLPALELGSGAGFMRDFIPNLITSEVFACENVDMVLDARSLPFSDNGLRAIVMTDVLHHIPDVRRFLTEATRCVSPGGIISMIEPWVTPWSKWVYSNLHHEPFDKKRSDWDFPASGPLSGANGALPWIVFQRDRRLFEAEFPLWQIRTIRPFMPFRYLFSGGVSMRSLMPGFTFGFWRTIENMLSPLHDWLSMFAQVTLVRKLDNAHVPAMEQS